jgi:hypothetical protein
MARAPNQLILFRYRRKVINTRISCNFDDDRNLAVIVTNPMFNVLHFRAVRKRGIKPHLFWQKSIERDCFPDSRKHLGVYRFEPEPSHNYVTAGYVKSWSPSNCHLFTLCRIIRNP